jgi:hypothetical protein
VWPSLPSKVWAFMLPVTSAAAAASFAFYIAEWRPIIYNTLGIWVVAQIGYELIVQNVKDLFSKKKGA